MVHFKIVENGIMCLR